MRVEPSQMRLVLFYSVCVCIKKPQRAPSPLLLCDTAVKSAVYSQEGPHQDLTILVPDLDLQSPNL